MKKTLILFCSLFFTQSLFSSERGLIDLAELHYQNREYYNAVTETYRYRYLYPQGSLFPQSMLITGKSYYHGGETEKALSVLSECYGMYSGTSAGETALFYSGLIRLEKGLYNSAAKNFREYSFIYNTGLFSEEALINLSLIYVFAENYDNADKELAEYKRIFPGGKLNKKSEELSLIIAEQRGKTEKNLYIAGISSALIPGSGYFYTEKYMLGIFSFLTNGALIYGIYSGYKKKETLQMIFFSVIEFSFYNYSIIGSIKSADDYNRGRKSKEEILAGFRKTF